jgi:hypothetical protein
MGVWRMLAGRCVDGAGPPWRRRRFGGGPAGGRGPAATRRLRSRSDVSDPRPTDLLGATMPPAPLLAAAAPPTMRLGIVAFPASDATALSAAAAPWSHARCTAACIAASGSIAPG